ncbi:MAG: ubiquinone-binding protein [Gammaproteobacteria bacterium]|nr:MAG: ubiquinone-binding protein [Gammaproteobacteria bacterium]
MTQIDRSALLPYTAEQLFMLVDDIESYPHYMDGCVAAEVFLRTPAVVEARLDLAKGGVRQSFSTRNYLTAPESIELELLEGPFQRFTGRWRFKALGECACKVSLQLEFSIDNALVGLAMARLFDSVTDKLVEAVSRRARAVYG